MLREEAQEEIGCWVSGPGAMNGDGAPRVLWKHCQQCEDACPRKRGVLSQTLEYKAYGKAWRLWPKEMSVRAGAEVHFIVKLCSQKTDGGEGVQLKASRDEDEYVAHVADRGAVRIGGNADLLCERPARKAGGPTCRAAPGT